MIARVTLLVIQPIQFHHDKWAWQTWSNGINLMSIRRNKWVLKVLAPFVITVPGNRQTPINCIQIGKMRCSFTLLLLTNFEWFKYLKISKWTLQLKIFKRNTTIDPKNLAVIIQKHKKDTYVTNIIIPTFDSPRLNVSVTNSDVCICATMRSTSLLCKGAFIKHMW